VESSIDNIIYQYMLQFNAESRCHIAKKVMRQGTVCFYSSQDEGYGLRLKEAQGNDNLAQTILLAQQ
jgi:hypothetical protein